MILLVTMEVHYLHKYNIDIMKSTTLAYSGCGFVHTLQLNWKICVAIQYIHIYNIIYTYIQYNIYYTIQYILTTLPISRHIQLRLISGCGSI